MGEAEEGGVAERRGDLSILSIRFSLAIAILGALELSLLSILSIRFRTTQHFEVVAEEASTFNSID